MDMKDVVKDDDDDDDVYVGSTLKGTVRWIYLPVSEHRKIFNHTYYIVFAITYA